MSSLLDKKFMSVRRKNMSDKWQHLNVNVVLELATLAVKLVP